MSVLQILSDLRHEREILDAVIANLERLAVVGTKPRRGRPPKWLQQAKKNGKAAK